jgi:hypothetical protein
MPGWPCRAGMPRWQTCEDFPYVFKRRPSGPPRGQLRRAGLAPCRFAPGASRRRMRGVDGQTAASEVLTRRTEGQALTALLTYVPVLAAPSRLQLGRRTIMPPAGSASAPTTRDGLRRPGLPPWTRALRDAGLRSRASRRTPEAARPRPPGPGRPEGRSTWTRRTWPSRATRARREAEHPPWTRHAAGMVREWWVEMEDVRSGDATPSRSVLC